MKPRDETSRKEESGKEGERLGARRKTWEELNAA